MKKIANTMDPGDQLEVANRLRLLADEIESGAVSLTEVAASVNLLDTTPEDAPAGSFKTAEVDHTSYLFLLRFARPRGARREIGVTFERHLRDEVDAGRVEHRVRAQVREDGSLTFYVHPMNSDGETRDFQARGNLLRPDPFVTPQDATEATQ